MTADEGGSLALGRGGAAGVSSKERPRAALWFRVRTPINEGLGAATCKVDGDATEVGVEGALTVMSREVGKVKLEAGGAVEDEALCLGQSRV